MSSTNSRYEYFAIVADDGSFARHPSDYKVRWVDRPERSDSQQSTGLYNWSSVETIKSEEFFRKRRAWVLR